MPSSRPNYLPKASPLLEIITSWSKISHMWVSRGFIKGFDWTFNTDAVPMHWKMHLHLWFLPEAHQWCQCHRGINQTHLQMWSSGPWQARCWEYSSGVCELLGKSAHSTLFLLAYGLSCSVLHLTFRAIRRYSEESGNVSLKWGRIKRECVSLGQETSSHHVCMYSALFSNLSSL